MILNSTVLDYLIGAGYASYGSSQAVITELNSTILINQNIRRFKVSMEHLTLVKILNGAKQVVNDSLYMYYLQTHVAFK